MSASQPNGSTATPARKPGKQQQPSQSVADRDDVKAITVETDQLTTAVTAIVIKTPDQYVAGATELQKIKGAMNRLETLRLSITRPMDTAKKAVMELFRAPEQKLTTAEASIKRAMLGYTQEQERQRREEQARADAAARKQQEKLQGQAAKALASGNTERAMQLETRASAVVAPVVQPETPKVYGISTRDNWKAECSDLRALVKAVYEGRAPLSYLTADDKVLGQQARSLKQDFVCDGVRVWNAENIAAGAA